MAIESVVQPLVQLTDPDFKNGYEEAQLPWYHDCKFKTDLALVDAIKSFLTEIAEEGQLTEQVIKHNTGFIIGILGRA